MADSAYSIRVRAAGFYQEVIPGNHLVVAAMSEAHYQVLRHQNGELSLHDDLVVIRRQDDVEIHYADGTTIIFQDYVSKCQQQSCSIQLPLTPDAPPAVPLVLSEQVTLLYRHGESESVLLALQPTAQGRPRNW